MASGGVAMEREMHEQPLVAQSLIDRSSEIERLAAEVHTQRSTRITLVARGSSDNSALFARYLFEWAGLSAELAAPSLWTRYGRFAAAEHQILIALSQSGQTPEIERIVRMAAHRGVPTLTITNHGDSPLARASHTVVALEVGDEIAVPATKTFTAQLLVSLLVANALADPPLDYVGDLAAIPDAQRAVLADESSPMEAIELFREARAIVTLGSGFLYSIAREAALKILETSSIPVLAFSANDFLHGPVAVEAPDIPVICFAGPGAVISDVRAAACAAAAAGAPVLWVSEEDFSQASIRIPVPRLRHEVLGPLVHGVRAQQIALMLSRALGANPDAPRGLNKVTPTS